MKLGRLALACALAALSAAPAVVSAQNGRYLPGTLNLGGLTGETWVNPPGPDAEYNAPITYGPWSLGNARFTYDRYRATSGTDDVAGAGLAGGFFFDAPTITLPSGESGTMRLCDGWDWRWVQIVRSTHSGQNEWGAPNNTWFPDTQSNRNNPSYPFQSLPVVANPAPTQSFQDFPWRYFDDPQTWRAELALTVINKAYNEVCIIGSFTWGFDIVNPTPTTVRIDPFAPQAWQTGGSGTLLSTLTDAFDGDGLTGGNPNNSKAWTIHQDCLNAFCVPAPGMLLVLIPGCALASRRRRVA